MQADELVQNVANLLIVSSTPTLESRFTTDCPRIFADLKVILSHEYSIHQSSEFFNDLENVYNSNRPPPTEIVIYLDILINANISKLISNYYHN